MFVRLERIIDPEYEICPCRHIKTRTVIRAIRKKNITSLRQLCKIVGVGDKCGGCREELKALLDYCLDEDILTMDLLFDD